MTAARSSASAWTECWCLGADGREHLAYTLTLPIRTVSETNQREYWAARHRRRKRQRADAYLIVGLMARVESLRVPCVVTLTRIAPRGLDGDNLQGALKAIRDGVADGLGVDDGDPRITWLYDQRRGGAKSYGVEITIGRGQRVA